jgi:hypothetical protein
VELVPCLVTKTFAVLETSIQLSNYRDKLRAYLNDENAIEHLAIQLIIRDAGTATALERGITEKAPMVRLNGISSHWIDRYFRIKRERLFEALRTNIVPKCKKIHTWEGRKCQKVCSVREHCKLLGKDGEDYETYSMANSNGDTNSDQRCSEGCSGTHDDQPRPSTI